MLTKLLATYGAAMGSVGFYRGYNSLYFCDGDDDKRERDGLKMIYEVNYQHPLITVRIIHGICGALLQLIPPYQPWLWYGMSLRMEKRLRQQPLTAYDYTY